MSPHLPYRNREQTSEILKLSKPKPSKHKKKNNFLKIQIELVNTNITVYSMYTQLQPI